VEDFKARAQPVSYEIEFSRQAAKKIKRLDKTTSNRRQDVIASWQTTLFLTGDQMI
jgi:mRNA-degrading endonuclease RelE of RelBE toxin-antitoxin system